MKPIVIVKKINAPLAHIFQVISNCENFQKAVPHIKKVEYLSEIKHGLGTKFRETRMMQGKEVHAVLEVTEFVENDRIRMMCTAGGTTWDTLFRVSQNGAEVDLELEMKATPHNILARIFNWMIRGMISKGVEADMDCVKQYCEQPG